MVTLQNISYNHPNKDLLFYNVNLTINRHDKVALIGNNGIGKSTLLGIMAGILKPSKGTVHAQGTRYYIPQLFGQHNHLSISEALKINKKLKALKEILSGKVDEANLTLLDDDWTLEERCRHALDFWQLDDLDLDQKVGSLSGGQKTRVFLAGISIHQPGIILMDEPDNHLDEGNRRRLYDFVQTTTSTLVVVSHNRELLKQLQPVYELSREGITVYGGDYEFYVRQKMIEKDALREDIRNKEKALRKAKLVKQKALEKKQKLDARGRKKQEKAGMPKVAMNALKNNAEKSTARMKGIHTEKTDNISRQLHRLRKSLPGLDEMKFDFDNSSLHTGKVLIDAKHINFGYGQKMLWDQPLDIMITSGERIAVKGPNGSGKTTLVKMILGEIEPKVGFIHRFCTKAVYIDQDYAIIDDKLSVYDQALQFNSTALQEHEIKTRLNRFLFTKNHWGKPCAVLSGGEKMRLMLCCLTISSRAPDLIILDEPTNNLDIQNMEILTTAINDYQGTLIVIAHDQYFLDEINIKRSIDLG